MRKQMVLLAVLACSLSLSSCATDGTFASSTKPVDKTQTLKAACEGLSKIDATFQAFARAEPNVVPANVMDIEGGIVSTFYSRGTDGSLTPIGVCAPPYATNLDVALNNLIAATISVTTLLAHWKT